MQPTTLIDLEAIKKDQVALHVQSEIAQNMSFPAAVLPDGYKIVELDHLNESPSHFKDSRHFGDLTEWVRYLSDNISEEGRAVCFIDADNMQANTTLDRGMPGNPGHCFHKASLSLKQAPEYKALNDINGDSSDQQSLAEWVEDWAHCITGTDTEGKEMTAKQVAHSFRKVTIKATATSENEAGDFNQSRSVLEKIEASNQERQAAYVEMTFEPFDDLTFYNFVLRVSITGKGGEPRITLRCVGLEIIKREMAQEFKKLVTMHLEKTPIKVYVGK